MTSVKLETVIPVCAVLMVICICKGVAECGGYTCSSTMTVCPGTSVMCSCTINSLYNQWSFSQALCAGSAIKLNHSNDNQQCGQFIRAWNEPSHNSTELRVCSTILIRASRDLDGLTFECQDGTNGSDDVPTSYGRTALSVISVPDNPRITHVNSDNPTVLTIEWSPAENGSRPNHFNVTISIFGVSVPLSTASVAFEDGRLLSYSYTFTGLTSDTDYNVSVVSINCAGISSSVYQAGVKTDDAFKETMMYAAIFLVLLILTGLLCAVIFYKCRHQGYERLPDNRRSTRPSSSLAQGQAQFSESQNPPAPSSEDQNPPAPSSEGQNPPAPSFEGQNPPAASSEGQNPPAPSSECQNPPAPSSDGQHSQLSCSAGTSSGQIAKAPNSRGPPITLRQLKFGLKLTDANGEKKTLNVITRAIKEYKNLGMLLLNDDNLHFVKTLEHKHYNDPQKIIEEIFGTWIENKGPTPVDWGALIDVFRQVELNALADDIQGALANADP